MSLVDPGAIPFSVVHQGRNVGLDLARAAALLAVLADHTLATWLSPLGSVGLQWIGEAGVELFFSLSGFLIGGILISDSQANFGPRLVGRFWFRRWMRTLPAYYVALWSAGWFWDVPDFPAYGFLQNFYPEERHALSVSWSLVLEEFFLFLFSARNACTCTSGWARHSARRCDSARADRSLHGW